jgi:hypothetical protein
MKEFDSYQPGMWVDDGMITPFRKRPAGRRVPRRAPWKEMLVIPVLSLAVTVGSVSLSASSSEAIEMVKRQVPRERATDIGENQVPSEYWPKLVDRLKKAAVLPESDAPRPDPLF